MTCAPICAPWRWGPPPDEPRTGQDAVDLLGRLDQQIADRISDCILALLQQHGLPRRSVVAIGSHGQTIRHRPGFSPRFTLQIGDPNRIAERTGIPVVADLRRRDMAAGGQAAPLVPPAHRALFGPIGPEEQLIVINLGGISNVTITDANGQLLGFDTGPANTLMDAWIGQERNLPCDLGGAWAASGSEDEDLLRLLLADRFFHQRAPKSTGIEHFNLRWLHQQGGARLDTLAPQDVQATLAALTADSLINALQPWLDPGQPGRPTRVVVAGGGALNDHLMTLLRRRLQQCHPSATLQASNDCGIAPKCVESAAFAWLARQFLLGQPGNAPSVTGAAGPRILGGFYPA